MVAASELKYQASKLKVILSNTDESEILGHADELLLFLNRIKDFFHHHSNIHFPLSSIDDIIHGLESNPELTLQDKSIRERLLNLFIRF
jgi:hypothetical protein